MIIVLGTVLTAGFIWAYTIHLGEHQLEVEQACSGLRIFMGIVALAFAYVIIVRRPWWEKALLLVQPGPPRGSRLSVRSWI